MLQPEAWEKYFEPGTGRPWFWHKASAEVFYADDVQAGWERFEDRQGKPWCWWNEASERFFFEEEE